MKYKLDITWLDGRKQTPKDLDFNITPSLVFAHGDKEEIGDLGYAYAIGVKLGYWAVAIRLFGAYIKPTYK